MRSVQELKARLGLNKHQTEKKAADSMGLTDAVALANVWLNSSCQADTVTFDGETYHAADVAMALSKALVEFHRRATAKAEEQAMYDALAEDPNK